LVPFLRFWLLPARYGTRMDVADLLGLDQIYQLERKYGVSQLPVA
jgi:hypothetical protein